MVVLPGCGKKGPPLPPLHLAPAAVTDVSARRADGEVQLRFVLPKTNQNAPGPVDMGRVDVFAVTVDAGRPAPDDRELFSAANRVGTIETQRPVEEPAPDAQPPDPRPGPGETATFVERVAALPPAAPAAPPPAAADSEEDDGTARIAARGAVRVYAVRAVTRRGRAGAASEKVEVPLGPPPAAPPAPRVSFTEDALRLEWLPPLAAVGGAAVRFNVYAVGDAPGLPPLNDTPLAEPAFERPGVEFGREVCFVVRTVEAAGRAIVESAPSAPACVTPRDIFPPAAPTGLAAVAGPGAISLIWDANTEPDLAGYLVLRGEAPGDTLHAITATPIADTTYRDTDVQPGVRYVYAVVAVDRATPPNASPQSARVEETAR